MDAETIKIKKVTGKCPACEDYAEKNSTTPPKIAVMACEGACARGEVARRAANLVAHRLAADSTVRICLGGAFTKDTGQRNLVRRAEKVIAIEGCFINCSSRMMEGVLPELTPEIVRADLIYNLDLPFGIDEVPDEMFTIYAHQVAERVVTDYLNGAPAPSCQPPACATGPAPVGCGCRAAPVSCSAGPGCSAGSAGDPQVSPDVVNVQWDGTKIFRAANPRGGSLSVDDGTGHCTSLEALMAALGGCVSSALLSQLRKDGADVRTLSARVSGTRSAGLPAAYEKIHIIFSLDANRDDDTVGQMIHKAVTVLCPVAVTLGRAADLTWEFRRGNAE
jgi:uncharacterized OsmC-like protein/uncharacterized metal-binding protein